jgi:enoyl-CoA hydratase
VISTNLHANGVYELVVDCPPVNAFGIPLLDSLATRLKEVLECSQARAVLLRAAGRGFSAGGDVKEVERLEGFQGILGQAKGALTATLAILECPLPVICAVHNYCIGVGVLIAASADILVAAEGTKFVLAEVESGATTGAVYALRLMSEKRARAAMMTAEPVYAEELLAYGSVLKIVPPVNLEDAAMTVAASVASKPPQAMKRLKESFNNTAGASEVRTLYRAELSYTYELNIIGEASQGRKAFIEKVRGGY